MAKIYKTLSDLQPKLCSTHRSRRKQGWAILEQHLDKYINSLAFKCDKTLVKSYAFKRLQRIVGNKNNKNWEYTVSSVCYWATREGMRAAFRFEQRESLNLELFDDESTADQINDNLQALNKEEINKYICQERDRFILNARLGLLHEYENKKLTYAAIGRILGVPPRTVKTRLKKILTLIKNNVKTNTTFTDK